MEPTLFGVPLGLYGIPCLILSFLFIIIWPRQIAPERGPRRLILRWGHALVWLLLGFAAFVGGTQRDGMATARVLALAALAVYVIFVATLVTTKRP